MAYANPYALAQIARAQFLRRAGERDSTTRFKLRKDWSKDLKLKVSSNIDQVSASPLEFVDAQFDYLTPAFCMKVWRTVYPISGCLITEGARWRYRQWKQAKDSKKKPEKRNISLSKATAILERNLGEVSNWGDAPGVVEDVLIIRISSGVIPPEVVRVLYRSKHPAITSIWEYLKDLPFLQQR